MLDHEEGLRHLRLPTSTLCGSSAVRGRMPRYYNCKLNAICMIYTPKQYLELDTPKVRKRVALSAQRPVERPGTSLFCTAETV